MSREINITDYDRQPFPFDYQETTDKEGRDKSENIIYTSHRSLHRPRRSRHGHGE